MPISDMNDDGTGVRMSQGGQDRDNDGRIVWGRDTTARSKAKDIPIGLFQWKIEPRLGTVIEAENNDTVVHNFQSFNNTEGYNGEYSFLGNVGSPRLSRIFLHRKPQENYIFLQPFSFFREALQDFRFTNTFSPITNLAYHKCGNNQNGEDRVRAYFASNINKVSGIGFKLDYLYGRGYYNSQPNSMFGATLYGYYLGERYNMHAYMNINDLKMGENGGIEEDRYIENPQSFPQRYGSKDIPVSITDTWNRSHEQNYYMTHKYNVGIYRDIYIPDSLKPKVPADSDLLMVLSDSIRDILHTDSVARQLAVDSLRRRWESQQVNPQEFIPVTSFIHTLNVHTLNHSYLSHKTPEDYYTNHYYGSWNAVHDDTKGLCVRNTLGVALREGFNKWAQMGLTFFGTHALRTYTLPLSLEETKRYTENDISVGAEISRAQGKLIHYNALGEIWLVGENVGDFDINGHADLEFRISRKDSLIVDLHGYVKHQKPGFYYRHYHSQSTWWDNSHLDREIKTRIEGTLRLKNFGTRLNVGVENLTNYTYFGIDKTLKDESKAGSTITADYTHAVSVKQHDGNIQVFSASLAQDLKFGIVHWDNEITYQKTSNSTALPLPQLNVYSNLYLLFRVAKVLRVQFGGDIRYFTSYYAPDYAPSIGQFAVQDPTAGRVKIGNYPIVNVYANLHLKHCRLYASVNHVNAGSGHSFWAPHYPINPLTIHLGLSWNFFN